MGRKMPSMAEWKAGELQTKVMLDENRRDYDYDSQTVRAAVVHTRQDLVLIVSYLNSISKQHSKTNFLLFLNALLLFLLPL